jgi:nucleotide-binding universal stress UspA family protein
MKKIVCAFDGSDHAMKAAQAASELAQKFGGTLSLVYVVEPYAPPVDLPGISFVDWVEPHRKAARRLVTDAADALAKDTGIRPEAEVRVGAAAQEITAFAEDAQADLLVIGSRGLGTVKRLLLGSVADRVVHLSTVPVLVVR